MGTCCSKLPYLIIYFSCGDYQLTLQAIAAKELWYEPIDPLSHSSHTILKRSKRPLTNGWKQKVFEPPSRNSTFFHRHGYKLSQCSNKVKLYLGIQSIELCCLRPFGKFRPSDSSTLPYEFPFMTPFVTGRGPLGPITKYHIGIARLVLVWLVWPFPVQWVLGLQFDQWGHVECDGLMEILWRYPYLGSSRILRPNFRGSKKKTLRNVHGGSILESQFQIPIDRVSTCINIERCGDLGSLRSFCNIWELCISVFPLLFSCFGFQALRPSTSDLAGDRGVLDHLIIMFGKRRRCPENSGTQKSSLSN